MIEQLRQAIGMKLDTLTAADKPLAIVYKHMTQKIE